MKTFAIALLLFTASANAQWVSPIEQSYGPYLAPSIDAEPAIIASKDRVLLAWCEVDPITKAPEIRTGILDFHGRLTGAITKLPTQQAAAAATSPVVATDGETFAVAWVESWKFGAAIALGADGVPAGGPRPFNLAADTMRTPLIWNGEAYQVNGIAFDGHGQPAFPEMDMPALALQYAFDHTIVGMKWTADDGTTCHWGRHGCVYFNPNITITWEIVREKQRKQESKDFPHYTKSSPIVAGDDNEMAIVWRAPNEYVGARVVDGSYQSSFTFFRFDPLEAIHDSTEPEGIAFDGERWLVVFTRNHDIWGAFIDRNRSQDEIEPFPIATSDRFESHARVTKLAPGRFLVSYSSDLGPDDHRFAGRVVTLEPPARRRSMR